MNNLKVSFLTRIFVNMNRKIITQFLFGSTIGIGGYLLGQYNEKQQCSLRIEKDFGLNSLSYCGEKVFECDRLQLYIIEDNVSFISLKNQITPKPGLPIFGTVSAAVPAPTSPNYAIEKQKRISQIMQYGFPGFDNIRSFDDFVLVIFFSIKLLHILLISL